MQASRGFIEPARRRFPFSLGWAAGAGFGSTLAAGPRWVSSSHLSSESSASCQFCQSRQALSEGSLLAQLLSLAAAVRLRLRGLAVSRSKVSSCESSWSTRAACSWAAPMLGLGLGLGLELGALAGPGRVRVLDGLCCSSQSNATLRGACGKPGEFRPAAMPTRAPGARGIALRGLLARRPMSEDRGGGGGICRGEKRALAISKTGMFYIGEKTRLAWRKTVASGLTGILIHATRFFGSLRSGHAPSRQSRSPPLTRR